MCCAHSTSYLRIRWQLNCSFSVHIISLTWHDWPKSSVFNCFQFFNPKDLFVSKCVKKKYFFGSNCDTVSVQSTILARLDWIKKFLSNQSTYHSRAQISLTNVSVRVYYFEFSLLRKSGSCAMCWILFLVSDRIPFVLSWIRNERKLGSPVNNALHWEFSTIVW